MDVVTLFGLALHSAWLMPVLAVMVAVDGPIPILPSETLLLTALAVALAERDVATLAGLFLAAVLGSIVGDLIVFSLGRSSRRIFAQSAGNEHQLARWVRCNVLGRPGVTMVGARFVPGGRLVSTAAAGRFGLPLSVFVPWSVVSSVAWSVYMTLLAMLINPLTDGSPLAALLAGTAVALFTAAGFAAAKILRDRWTLRPRDAT